MIPSTRRDASRLKRDVILRCSMICRAAEASSEPTIAYRSRQVAVAARDDDGARRLREHLARLGETAPAVDRHPPNFTEPRPAGLVQDMAAIVAHGRTRVLTAGCQLPEIASIGLRNEKLVLRLGDNASILRPGNCARASTPDN